MKKQLYEKKSGKEIIDPEVFETTIGIDYIKHGEDFVGYLSNIKPYSKSDDDQVVTEKSNQTSCLLLFFYLEIPDDRGNVLKKCLFKYEPYFYILIKQEIIEEFQQYVSKRFEDKIASTEIIEKVDLNMVNHLSGIKKQVLKVNFKNVSNLVQVRNALKPYVQKNKMKEKILTYSELLNPSVKVDMIEMIQDLREDDIPYHVRVCIDNEIRCGFWYNVSSNENGCSLTQLPDKLNKCPLTVLAFDIETTKAPLKFPDAKIDSIMLLSYMIDGDGYLITNRNIISEDIQDFQYPPKLEFEGFFHIFNEENEEELLKRFVIHCKERRPNIFVTFNGDYFDIPFIDQRMKVYGMSMESLLGIANTVSSVKPGEGEYMGRFSVHIDCFYWVKRDAFLPQGSHGLKAVTKAKLGYDPIEVDPEEMLPMARNNPKKFCEYSVSDALATYYLYRLMIHDFIYALCTIIPTNPDEVLRKGSGTLCEELLMAQAYRRNIIFPEKQVQEFEKFYQGHFIDSETYIGGHVECLNVGVYRSDIPTTFELDPSAYDELSGNIDQYLNFTLEIENKQDCGIESIVNYTKVVEDIKSRLMAIKDLASSAFKNEIDLTPLIYHLDVGAMYPNIILTNKLQPVSMVNEQICAGCLYNREDSNCKRYMKWSWKAELFPLSRSEYENLKQQYEWELLSDDKEVEDLNVEEHRKGFLKRIKNYCSKVYKQVHLKKVELKEGIVCMKENSFYVDTIRDFRDRRYEFKYLVKKWKGKLDEAKASKNIEEIQNAKNMMELYESLQLAHKIILNSFYGYVMRKGSRWFSMEMAAMVTHMGSNLITDARQFCERIGKPLELDTDGIWCCLPKGFPEVYQLELKSGKKINYSFPCTMLNALIYDKYSNPQFAYPDDKGEWNFRNEMSIFFEVDGPYRCMVLPAAKEEGKMLKKRYAVFGFDGRITELKGFELKRRGELKIIKIFQAEVFNQFLKGSNLSECYAACAEIANRWYSILEAEGRGINDEELIEYIEESRMMSKSLAEYGAQKSTAITCAKRLADLTSNSALLKDKGLCTKFIISKKPLETPVAERAIPTAVFKMVSSQMTNGLDATDRIKRRNCLRKWLRDQTLEEVDMRDVIDWNYYKERLASNILKILIIPAALQQIGNPYPNIPYPDWVHKLMLRKQNIQKSLNLFYNKVSNVDRMISVTEDLEKMNIKREKKKKEEPKAKKVSLEKYLTENYEPKNKSSIPMQKDIEEINEETINIADDFDKWLNQQKRKWKNCVNKKKQNDQNQSVSNNVLKINNITNQEFAHLELDFKKSPLRIIQVLEDPCNNGNLQLWVSFNKYMTKITVSIKRKIFINSMKKNAPNFTLTQMSLPRNKPVLNLYEVDIEEKVFREKLNNFNDYIIDPNIEGVYEAKIPLIFQLIKEYGCLIRFSNKRKNFSLNSSFSFEDFESILEDVLSPYEHSLETSKIFLYHSNLGGRHFLSLFIYPIHKAYIYIINPMNKNIDVPNVKKIIMNFFAKDYAEFASSIEFDFEFTTIVERDIRIAFNNVNKILMDIRSSSTIQGSTIILLQSCYQTQKIIEQGLNCLYTQYPVMKIPFNAEENDYPALDWIKFAIKKAALRYIDLTAIYDFRCQLARYCSVPACNLDFDPMIYCADFIFSRLLKGSKQVLWYSPNGFPDLGGGDMNQDFLGELECQFPKVNNPSMYLGYSAEIDLGLFCVNSILESDHMKDFSGKYELSYLEKPKTKMYTSITIEEYKKQLEQYRLERDEYALGSNAFIVMKKMVEKWLNDVRGYENPCADYLLVHFYRWISSFNSKFYDPVVYRMINLLMQKYFSILIRKITDFGFKIIYADNKKLILFNNKSNLSEFQASIDYLFRSIKKIPIFNHIILTPNNCWKMLLFKDLYNFSGISANEDEHELSNSPRIISNWSISEYLPPVLDKDFVSLISDYMTKLYRFFYLKDVDMIINLYAVYQNNYYSIEEVTNMIEGETGISNFKDFLITDYLSTKIFNMIPNILIKRKYDYDKDEEINDDNNNTNIIDYDNNNNNEAPLFTREDFIDEQDSEYDDEAEGEDISTFKQIQVNKKSQFNKAKTQWEYPLKLGSYGAKRTNACLEYINDVCEIFEVDSQIKSQTMVLKKNCLKLINIEEYSKETYFQDPCRTFTLRDVLCEFCSTNKDIDFCRDDTILSQKWLCDNCNSQYDKDLIEFRVIKKVQNVINYYYNQDLQCIKCKNQKDDYLFTLCTCAGNYSKTFDENFQRDYPNMKSIRDLIQTLQDISHYYQFNYLKALLNDYK